MPSTYEQQQRHKIRRRDITRTAKDVPCLDCGQRFPHYIMDFDHRPGEMKAFAISARNSMNASLDRLIAEIAKCDVVCSNCHRERTHQRKQYF